MTSRQPLIASVGKAGLKACALTIVLAAAVLSSDLLSVHAQAPAPQSPTPTFKAGTSLVEVDIIARDKGGRFVSGLTADDFEVLEEGKPQPIEHFYLVTEEPTTSTEPRPDVVLPRSPDRTDRRIFVLYFDSQHLSSGHLVTLKQTALDFIGSSVRPADLGGVFVNGTLAHNRLTTDRQELLDAIHAVTPAFETTEMRARLLLEFPRIDSIFDAARVESDDKQFIQELAAKTCGDDTRQCALEGGREFVEDALQRKARRFIEDSRRAANATVQGLSYVIKNLSRLEGRKTVVFLSEGFYVDDVRSTLPILAGQAARAGITIYGIDVRGTNAVGGIKPGDATMSSNGLSGFGDTSDDGLDMLADGTGGMTVRHTDDYTRALAQVAADTSTYYVLAYSSENPVLDGKFRRITLKVKWEGLTVRARRGYVASPLPPAKQIRSR
jgi:VWFA-related protein